MCNPLTIANRLKSLGHGGLRLHLIRLLETRGPGPETVPDPLTPGSIDETLRLLEHRLRLEVAIGIDLARSDSGQRGVDRLGIELSTRERELRVVEEPLGSVVFPTLPRLESAVVEPGEEWSGIYGRHFDAELLKLEAHRLG